MYIKLSETKVQVRRIFMDRLSSIARYVRSVFWHLIESICISPDRCVRKDDFYSKSKHLIGENNKDLQNKESLAVQDLNDDERGILKALNFNHVHKEEEPKWQSHQQPCFESEEDEAQCLNDGKCFAIELHNGIRRAGCSCGPEWMGERCEMRYIDPIYWSDPEEHVKRAEVNPAILVIIIFIVILFSFSDAQKWFKRRKQKRVRKCCTQLQTYVNTHLMGVEYAESVLSLERLENFTSKFSASNFQKSLLDQHLLSGSCLQHYHTAAPCCSACTQNQLIIDKTLSHCAKRKILTDNKVADVTKSSLSRCLHSQDDNINNNKVVKRVLSGKTLKSIAEISEKSAFRLLFGHFKLLLASR